LFWLCVAAGVLTAVGFTAPDTLRPIPTDLLAWLPRVLAAGLILLAGYAAGGALSAAFATGAQRALGQRSSAVELGTRWGIMAAAIILALTNIGVETTTLQIVVAGAILTVGLTASLLAGLGGQGVAKSVAAGRALRNELNVGDRIKTNTFEGTIVALRPAVVILQETDATTIVSYETLLTEPFQIRPEQGA
jgi:small-conductance mechanosensitive channel